MISVKYLGVESLGHTEGGRTLQEAMKLLFKINNIVYAHEKFPPSLFSCRHGVWLIWLANSVPSLWFQLAFS